MNSMNVDQLNAVKTMFHESAKDENGQMMITSKRYRSIMYNIYKNRKSSGFIDNLVQDRLKPYLGNLNWKYVKLTEQQFLEMHETVQRRELKFELGQFLGRQKEILTQREMSYSMRRSLSRDDSRKSPPSTRRKLASKGDPTKMPSKSPNFSSLGSSSQSSLSLGGGSCTPLANSSHNFPQETWRDWSNGDLLEVSKAFKLQYDHLHCEQKFIIKRLSEKSMIINEFQNDANPNVFVPFTYFCNFQRRKTFQEVEADRIRSCEIEQSNESSRSKLKLYVILAIIIALVAVVLHFSFIHGIVEVEVVGLKSPGSFSITIGEHSQRIDAEKSTFTYNYGLRQFWWFSYTVHILNEKGHSCSCSNGCEGYLEESLRISVECKPIIHEVSVDIGHSLHDNDFIQMRFGVRMGESEDYSAEVIDLPRQRFQKRMTFGETWRASITLNPSGKRCRLEPNESTVLKDEVIFLRCSIQKYKFEIGSIKGLVGDCLKIRALGIVRTICNGPFPFLFGEFEHGEEFSADIEAPEHLTCSFEHYEVIEFLEEDFMLNVQCQSDLLTIGGRISGLKFGELTLVNNGIVVTNSPAQRSFEFKLPYKTDYELQVSRQAEGHICKVQANGQKGTITRNTDNLRVTCVRLTHEVGVELVGLEHEKLKILCNGQRQTLTRDNSRQGCGTVAHFDIFEVLLQVPPRTYDFDIQTNNVNVTQSSYIKIIAKRTWNPENWDNFHLQQYIKKHLGNDYWAAITAEYPNANGIQLLDFNDIEVKDIFAGDPKWRLLSQKIKDLNDQSKTYRVSVHITIESEEKWIELALEGESHVFRKEGVQTFPNVIRGVGKSVSIDILDYPKGLKCALNSNVLVTAEAMDHASVKCVSLLLSLRGTITGMHPRSDGRNEGMRIKSGELEVSPESLRTFHFRGIPWGDAYEVEVSNNPAGYICKATENASGIIEGDVNNVKIECRDAKFHLFVRAQNTNGEIELKLSDGETLSVEDGDSQFEKEYYYSDIYEVKEYIVPESLQCAFNNLTGQFGMGEALIVIECEAKRVNLEVVVEGHAKDVAILLNERKQKIPFQQEMEYGAEFFVEVLNPEGFRCTPSPEKGNITSDLRVIILCIPTKWFSMPSIDILPSFEAVSFLCSSLGYIMIYPILFLIILFVCRVVCNGGVSRMLTWIKGKVMKGSSFQLNSDGLRHKIIIGEYCENKGGQYFEGPAKTMEKQYLLQTEKLVEQTFEIRPELKEAFGMTRDPVIRVLSVNLPGAKPSRDEMIENIDRYDSKVIMYYGGSGVGKSTQINAVANYVLGVQYSDEFRFRLIDEQFEEDKLLESQTRDITAYHFQWVEGFQCDTSIVLVDFPGMNDTARSKVKTKDNVDDTSMEMMKEFFDMCKNTDNEIVKRTICKIDAVAFLVRAGISRLTQEQKYTIHKTISALGNDLKDNIFLHFTYCTNTEFVEQPKMLNYLIQEDIPFRRDDWLTFRNEVLYSPHPIDTIASNIRKFAENKDFRDMVGKQPPEKAWDSNWAQNAKFFKLLTDKNSVKPIDFQNSVDLLHSRLQRAKKYKELNKDLEKYKERYQELNEGLFKPDKIKELYAGRHGKDASEYATDISHKFCKKVLEQLVGAMEICSELIEIQMTIQEIGFVIDENASKDFYAQQEAKATGNDKEIFARLKQFHAMKDHPELMQTILADLRENFAPEIAERLKARFLQMEQEEQVKRDQMDRDKKEQEARELEIARKAAAAAKRDAEKVFKMELQKLKQEKQAEFDKYREEQAKKAKENQNEIDKLQSKMDNLQSQKEKESLAMELKELRLKEQQRAERERLQQEAHQLEIRMAEKAAEDKMKANQHAKQIEEMERKMKILQKEQEAAAAQFEKSQAELDATKQRQEEIKKKHEQNLIEAAVERARTFLKYELGIEEGMEVQYRKKSTDNWASGKVINVKPLTILQDQWMITGIFQNAKEVIITNPTKDLVKQKMQLPAPPMYGEKKVSCKLLTSKDFKNGSGKMLQPDRKWGFGVDKNYRVKEVHPNSQCTGRVQKGTYMIKINGKPIANMVNRPRVYKAEVNTYKMAKAMGMIADRNKSRNNWAQPSITFTFTDSMEHHLIFMPPGKHWGMTLDGNFTVSRVLDTYLAHQKGIQVGWRLVAFQKPFYKVKILWGNKKRQNREEWESTTSSTAVTLIFYDPST